MRAEQVRGGNEKAKPVRASRPAAVLLPQAFLVVNVAPESGAEWGPRCSPKPTALPRRSQVSDEDGLPLISSR
jgi:hypothetical protein